MFRYLALLIFILIPSVVQACPSCFSSDGSNREAYFWTALIMTILPLTLIGGLIWMIRKHLGQSDDTSDVEGNT